MPESIMTAVLIHGAWAGGWVWEAITPYLEDQGFRVMAPDLPGCGKRLGNPAEASLDQCVAELEEMLQQVEGPLLLVLEVVQCFKLVQCLSGTMRVV